MKNIFLIVISLLAFPVLAAAQRSEASRYIGYRYVAAPPSNKLPNGVTHLGGAMVGDYDAETVYGVSQLQRGRTKMLWLEVSTGRDSSGVTGWKVLDVLSFPTLTRDDHLLIPDDPAVLCRRNRKDIANLVGSGRLNMRRGTFTPSRLWVANLETKKFVPLKLSGIRCEFSAP